MRRIYLLAVFILIGGATLPPLLSDHHAPSYQVVHDWPQLPDGFVLGEVAGVGVDSHNHVFVFHRGSRPILCLDGASGKIVASWGDGMFGSAHGLDVDPQDNVWVTDTVNHQITKFSHDGELLMTLGAKGVPGLDGNHFNKPTDIVVASSGEFYVSDGYGNSRVAKFSAEGKFLLDWGEKGDEPGRFDTPHGIAVDDQGRVYIADRANSRIQIFDGDGNFLKQWQSSELGRPWGLEIGADGHLYVADGGDLHHTPPGRNRVLKLDLKGNILEKWGSFGKYNGQLYWAHDVAVAPDGGVYVVDVSFGMRVQKFVPR